MAQTKLSGIPYKQARWIGGPVTPRLVVIHDTASRLEPGRAAAYLRDNDAKVSVHFVIERDGAIEQHVPLDRAAWHAGRSVYHGAEGVNGFSIGIELVGPGIMEDAGSHVRAWWGALFPKEVDGIAQVFFRTTPEHGAGWWMPPTDAQIVAGTLLLERLFEAVPTLEDIRGHWYVSPGRKVDPSPLFPMERIRTLVLGRDGADPDPVGDADGVWAPEDDDMVAIQVPGDGYLNMRRWPSFNPNVIARVPDGAVVPVVREGMFDGRHWMCVVYAGQEGWIVARYAARLLQGGAA